MSALVTVRTAGVVSRVLDDDGEVLGHVVAADYDDADLSTVREDARRLGGPVVVCESSPGSWHLWGLKVRPWSDVVDALTESRASTEFVEEMRTRGAATLRTHPKLSEESGEVVVEAPTPVAAFGRVPTHPNDGRVSWPHATRLAQMCERAESDGAVAEFLAAVEESDAAVGAAFGTAAWQYDTEGEEAGQ